MIAKEGQKQWSATSVFVQFSIVMIAAALVPAIIPGFDPKTSSILGLVISVIGIFASLVWLAFIQRFEKIVLYRVLSTREIEEQMSSLLMAFQRGKDFAAGDEVTVSGETIQYKHVERLPERWGLPMIYVTFLLIYAGLAVLNAIRLFSPSA